MIRLEQVIKVVKAILDACAEETRGRPRPPKPGKPFTYAPADIVLICLLQRLKGWSVNHTHQKLTDSADDTWRRLLGLTCADIPGRRWLNELQSHPVIQALRQQVYRRLRRQLLDSVDLSTLAVDLTPIEVDPAWDELAAWGYTSDDEPFYGYKVHLLCSADGLPLAIRVTRADGHELNEVCPLFAEAEALLGAETERVAYILGDAAYDAEAVYDDAHTHLDARFQADANRRNAAVTQADLSQMTPEIAARLADHPRRQQALYQRYQDDGRTRHKQRTMVEELFGMLKQLMPNFEDLQWFQAGIRRVRNHFRWLFCAFLAILARNVQQNDRFLAIKMVID